MGLDRRMTDGLLKFRFTLGSTMQTRVKGVMRRSGAGAFLLAFSLVELLVVISIIVLLVALTFPGLRKVQESSRTAKCLGNHRTITAAYIVYLTDNNNMLWCRPADGTWKNGSGGLFGPQNYSGAPGYLCYLLSSYGLPIAKWDSWKAIPARASTAWYCPATYGLTAISGHGATYYYQYPGNVLGVTQSVSLAAVSETISTNWFLCDYFGNHRDMSQLYSNPSSTSSNPFTRSYLDGHTEYR